LRSGRHFRDWARGVNGFLQKKVRLPRKWSERLNLGQNGQKNRCRSPCLHGEQSFSDEKAMRLLPISEEEAVEAPQA
jgi:hypothetical protein